MLFSPYFFTSQYILYLLFLILTQINIYLAGKGEDLFGEDIVSVIPTKSAVNDKSISAVTHEANLPHTGEESKFLYYVDK
jgi:hypothetical protein